MDGFSSKADESLFLFAHQICATKIYSPAFYHAAISLKLLNMFGQYVERGERDCLQKAKQNITLLEKHDVLKQHAQEINKLAESIWDKEGTRLWNEQLELNMKMLRVDRDLVPFTQVGPPQKHKSKIGTYQLPPLPSVAIMLPTTLRSGKCIQTVDLPRVAKRRSARLSK